MELQLKASIALIAGAAVAAASAAARLWPAGSGFSVLALPAIAWGGYMFLANWKGESGSDSSLWQYSFLVLCAFFIFGFALSPGLAPNLQLAAISVALLCAPLVEAGSRYSMPSGS